MKKYTKTHEWIEVEGDEATIGITEHAAGELGDVVFIDLPTEGQTFSASDVIAVVESVKAAGDVYAPVDCEVVAANEDLSALPDLLNKDSEGEGWLVKVKVTDAQPLDSLMTEEEYKDFVQNEE